MQQVKRDRHHDVVGYHGRYGNRGDDDHRRRRRESAEECKQREILAPQRQRQGQYVEIGVGAFGQEFKPGNGDRHDEQAHAKQVQREQPRGGRQVALVDVLDHGHLELARQADDRGCRQECQRYPARVENIAGTVDDLGIDVGKHLLDAAGHAVDHEQTDRKQRGELDHRLDRNRRDHAVMAFVGVDVARAEQDREQGHAGGDHERAETDVDVTNDGLVAARHRLQLQRDVGCGRHQSHQRDQHRDARALAVAR